MMRNTLTPYLWCVALSAVILCFFRETTSCADDDIAAVCQKWQAAAKSIKSVRLHLIGVEVHAAPKQRLASEGKAPGADTELPVDLEYTFASDSRERLSRRGKLPNSKGIGPYHNTEVRVGELRKLIFVGDPQATQEYDDFQILLRPVREALSDFMLLPFQILMQHPLLVAKFRFETDKLNLLPDSQVEIGGRQCIAAQRVSERDPTERTTFWFERMAPHRILRIEREGSRNGHDDYQFTYEETAVDLTAAFSWPSTLTATVSDLSGEVRVSGKCRIESAETNLTIADDSFDLPIPPGALVTDFTKSPPTAAVCLADGSLQTLSQAEQNRSSVLRISSSVRGSRVEGRSPTPPVKSSRYWLVAVVAINVLFFWDAPRCCGARNARNVNLEELDETRRTRWICCDLYRDFCRCAAVFVQL